MSVRKTFFGVGILVLIAGVFLGGTVAYINTFRTYQPAVISADCAVVFGAAVYPGGVASGALYERTHTAVQLFKDKHVHCVVFSGAESAYNAHEVDVMRDIAIDEGVPLEDMEFDHDGTNTRLTIAHLNKDRTYALVSNDFHLPRIDLLAHRAGLTYVLVPSEYVHGRYTREWLFVLREAAALWYYSIFSN
jgi:SanA protein